MDALMDHRMMYLDYPKTLTLAELNTWLSLRLFMTDVLKKKEKKRLRLFYLLVFQLCLLSLDTASS